MSRDVYLWMLSQEYKVKFTCWTEWYHALLNKDNIENNENIGYKHIAIFWESAYIGNRNPAALSFQATVWIIII